MSARQDTRPLGRIDATSMYTTAGCMKYCGIGHESLGQARRSGIVAPYPVGKQDYYAGEELIAWIKSHERKSRKAG